MIDFSRSQQCWLLSSETARLQTNSPIPHGPLLRINFGTTNILFRLPRPIPSATHPPTHALLGRTSLRVLLYYSRNVRS
jgi:hypothetical protein